ncbi:hypothetical protein HYP07_gp011 [Vibrio phage JSF3]|nr:hypothetical protein HYP07_gp011 [Vibrio phage JSF3]APD18023.1 hypothetical protein [Vibrio phage JSF3]
MRLLKQRTKYHTQKEPTLLVKVIKPFYLYHSNSVTVTFKYEIN